MQRIMFTLCCLVIGLPLHADGTIDFNRDVRPILSDKCFACHGPDKAATKADLRLDVRDIALNVITPGDPSNSKLIHRVTSTDPDDVMPPRHTHKRVTKREVEVLQRWIEQGVVYAPHWSFIPVSRPDVPRVKSNGLVNEIDRFVVARLQQENMQPAPRANRQTLIRRVTLDLIGLPPTPAEVHAFVSDPASDRDAFETVVDRLLKSPRYGEHMTYQWLDAARYADSDGYESDPLRNMWPWRDWVISAFNDNMPFDQFLIEQLAGDLLENSTLRQQLATGFNRNHRLNNEGGILPEEWIVEYVCDRAETTATVFMGLTWACARCHDHKYDPISQKDYYRLFAFFNTMDESGSARGASNAKPMLKVSALDRLEEYESVRKELSPFTKQFTARSANPGFQASYKKWIAELKKTPKAKMPKPLSRTPITKWKKAQYDQARNYYLKFVDPEGSETHKLSAALQKQLDGLARTGANVMVMADMPQPRPTHVLARGAYDKPTEKVTAGTPRWLPPMDEGLPNDRLGLAKWLVDKEHPLTARVAVNRIWERFMGTGLVKTQEDFGSQGELPSHPELLDYLAWQFMSTGWDVKAIQKHIVTSDTYCRSSRITSEMFERDPHNRLLARGPRYRLPAQVIRDQALAVSGLMNDTIGGRPVKPYQPDGLWREVIKGSPTYKRDTGDSLYRRSMYTLWRRAVKPPLMTLLDANERDTCRVNQNRTNTPQQALLLLNSVTFVEIARGLATRVLAEGGDRPDQRIAFAMKLVTAREPDDRELTILRDELTSYQRAYQSNPTAASELIAIGESTPPAGHDPVELAAYTAFARVLLNLDETITKE